MRRVAGLVILLVATAGFAQAGEDVRHCDFEVKARCASGDARVTLADGAVSKIEVNVFWCGLRGRPGYTCTIDSSRSDRDSKWSDENGASVIANTAPSNPAEPDRIKVTVGRAVSIDLTEAQSLGRCGAGAGAELPRAIVIPAKGKACRVWLGTP